MNRAQGAGESKACGGNINRHRSTAIQGKALRGCSISFYTKCLCGVPIACNGYGLVEVGQLLGSGPKGVDDKYVERDEGEVNR